MNTLKVRDLVNVGVFTVIYFIVTYATGMLGMFGPWMIPIAGVLAYRHHALPLTGTKIWSVDDYRAAHRYCHERGALVLDHHYGHSMRCCCGPYPI